MKHSKNFGKIAGYLFAVLLALVSVQAQAATDKVDREFNHRNSGYPLTGIHTTTPCESCHIGGVFRGTPRACDGCHAAGTRVSATPKSTKHIVTDAPCESCHFNTSTFFGARYNHGTAVRGECTNCHNGRIVEGTPRNHPVSPIAGASCDSCHRSSSWIPASWNHTDIGSDCSVCHKAGGPGRNYTSTRHSGTYAALNILATCKDCHTNYYTFYSYRYVHTGPGAAQTCGDCHANGAYADGVTQAVNAIHASATAVGITACKSCHLSYATFVGARYRHDQAYDSAYTTNCVACHDGTHTGIRGIPSSHTNGLTVLGNPSCLSCHGTSVWGTKMNHAIIGAVPCKQCHDSGLNTGSYFTGMEKKSNGHKGYNNATQDCISCHANQYNRWNHP